MSSVRAAARHDVNSVPNRDGISVLRPLRFVISVLLPCVSSFPYCSLAFRQCVSSESTHYAHSKSFSTSRVTCSSAECSIRLEPPSSSKNFRPTPRAMTQPSLHESVNDPSGKT